jgi:hypothetical protein
VARFAPLITLGTVAALGGGLLLLNTTIAGPPTVTTGTAVAAAAPETAVPPAVPLAEAPPPAAAPAVAEAAYTGRSAGNEVTVAVAVKDGKAVAYVCDGKKIEAWYEGTLTGADLSLSAAGGAPGITATVTDAATLGTVTVGDEELPFAAQQVAAPAGLYEGRASVKGVLTRIGWIVDEDGDVTGVANSGGTRRAAPDLDPTDLTGTRIGGVPVTVTPLDGSGPVIGR